MGSSSEARRSPAARQKTQGDRRASFFPAPRQHTALPPAPSRGAPTTNLSELAGIRDGFRRRSRKRPGAYRGRGRRLAGPGRQGHSQDQDHEKRLLHKHSFHTEDVHYKTDNISLF